MELISVLMPTYNVAPFVEDAVNSVLSQTYRNIELIIVDDCSTDETYRILEKISRRDSRVKLYRNNENQRICKTLNRALSYAKGSYIVRMDGDDVSTPERFRVLKDYLDEHKDIALVGSQTITINEKGDEVSKKRYPLSSRSISVGNQFMPALVHIWMARREVYETLRGYREIPYAEDYDFLLRGELQGYKYANVRDYLYKIRIRQGNTVSVAGLVQRKTAQYVKSLHKMERKAGKTDLFSAKEHQAKITTSKVESERYAKAARYLNNAIMSKPDKLTVIKNTLLAAVTSKFVFQYLISTTIIRLLILCEDYGMIRGSDSQ